MSRPITEPLPDVFAARDAYAHGFTKAHVRRKALTNIAYGVYAQKEVNYEEYVLARSRTVPDAVIASLTAARLYGFRGVSDSEDRALYLYRQSGKRVQQRGINQLHAALSDDETTLRDGERITTVQRTFLDLGCVLSLEALVAVADGLLARPRKTSSDASSLLTKNELEGYVASKRYHRGRKKCMQALMLAEVGSDSVKETELRLLLGQYGITGLALNPVIRDAQGRYVCEPDLADMEALLSIQYEGAHHGSLQQMRRDDRRRARTEAAGWVEVRIFAADLYEKTIHDGRMMPVAVAKVLQALA